MEKFISFPTLDTQGKGVMSLLTKTPQCVLSGWLTVIFFKDPLLINYNRTFQNVPRQRIACAMLALEHDCSRPRVAKPTCYSSQLQNGNT